MNVRIRQIEQSDDDIICSIIKTVGAEFGAIGDGFGPSDNEVLCMSQHYQQQTKSQYLVARVAGKVVGGCGIAPFGNSESVCELKKLFLLSEGRGLGIGRTLAVQCLEFAKEQGFESCYLDTLHNMTSAIALYEKLGFQHLDQPLAGTEHNGCDIWMLKAL